MLKDPQSTADAMQRNLCNFSVGLPLSLIFCVYLWFLPGSLRAQESDQEVVANLAAGRVVLYVARDAIVIGAVEYRVEPDSRPPLVLSLSERRLGILLGAVEWVWPASGRPPVRLDRDLPALLSKATRPQPKPEMEQASDMEVIGVTFLDHLRGVISQLHHKLDLQPDEPVVELLVVGYEPGYGPEVWLLAYRVAQDVLRGEYWRTRVLRPSYTQLYPPEKGQPRTLIEVRYPPDDQEPAIADLLKQNDPRLARLRTADQQMARATERLDRGESHKAAPDDAVAFIRAALPAVASTGAKLILGVLYQERGLQWVLAPPEPLQKADEGKPREPGAPTLRKKP